MISFQLFLCDLRTSLEEMFNLMPAPLLEELQATVQISIRTSWEWNFNSQDIEKLGLLSNLV
jgi:hypothetical protein